MPSYRATRADVLVVALASLAFATSSPLATLAEGLSPVAVAAGRTAIAASLLFLSRPRLTFDIYRSLSRRTWLGLSGAGVFLGAHFALFLGGLRVTSFPAAVALLSLEPLAVVVVGWLAFRLPPTRAEWLGILLATGGAFVVSRGVGTGEHRTLGDLMVVGAVVLYAGYIAMARGLRDTMPAVPYAATVYGIASLVLVPFAWPSISGDSPSLSTWVALLLLAVIPTLVGHTLAQVAARTVPPAMVALTSPGETVGSLAIGAFLLRKWPSPVEATGTLLIVIGAVVAIYGGRISTASGAGEVRSEP